MSFTDDMEGAAAGTRGATPSDFRTCGRGTRGRDGLLMLYAAAVGLPVLTPGPGLPAPLSSESFRLDCSTTVHAAAVFKAAEGEPPLPSGVHGGSADVHRRGGARAAATVRLLVDAPTSVGGAPGRAGEAEAAGGVGSPPLGAPNGAADALRRGGDRAAAAANPLDDSPLSDGVALDRVGNDGMVGGSGAPPRVASEGAPDVHQQGGDSATAAARPLVDSPSSDSGALHGTGYGGAAGGAGAKRRGASDGAPHAHSQDGDGTAPSAGLLENGVALDQEANGVAAGAAGAHQNGASDGAAHVQRDGDVVNDTASVRGSGVQGTPSNRASPGDRGPSLRSTVPLPFLRKMRLHMDSCPSTNKSQFFFGGLGMLLACGIFDCAQVLYMVVGHTKFGPDLVARSLAGIFNRSDVYNHGQLVRLFRTYATAGAYDEKILHTWKQSTSTIFTPIQHIMSHRCILLLADEGQVDLGGPVATPPPTFEPFPDPGPLFLDDVLMRECTKAAARGLRSSVFPALRRGAYQGIGRDAVGGLSEVPRKTMLLPSAVMSYRRVRLFTRRYTADPLWREQRGWMSATSVEQVNAAINHISPYGSEQRKMPYGAKAESIAKMYEKYVPRRFLPDDYDVPNTGASGMARAV